MNEQKTIDQIKERLEKFITDIDQVDPDEVKVEDIDEWIGLLDQLEEKVKTVSKKSVSYTHLTLPTIYSV